MRKTSVTACCQTSLRNPAASAAKGRIVCSSRAEAPGSDGNGVQERNRDVGVTWCALLRARWYFALLCEYLLNTVARFAATCGMSKHQWSLLNVLNTKVPNKGTTPLPYLYLLLFKIYRFINIVTMHYQLCALFPILVGSCDILQF